MCESEYATYGARVEVSRRVVITSYEVCGLVARHHCMLVGTALSDLGCHSVYPNINHHHHHQLLQQMNRKNEPKVCITRLLQHCTHSAAAFRCHQEHLHRCLGYLSMCASIELTI